jgi:hypothetical protein
MSLRSALSITSALVLSCGGEGTSSSPSSITQTVGPAGATIVVEGATVTIPKNALSAPKEITISASDGAAPGAFVALSRVFRCEPSGTSFSQPVTMQMPFTDDGKGGTMFWSTGADPTFKDVGGKIEGNTMTAEVRHFSSGFVGRKK